MKNRKSIMALSGLLILTFHLWISISNGSQFELFFKQLAFIGVDMFFFLSAYSLGKRRIDGYGKFVLSRFKSVYLKFIIFAVVAFIYLKWPLKKLLLSVTGIELFTKGGGAFLWFLPAIMIFYILFPFLQKADEKNRTVTLLGVLAGWALVSILVTYLTGYKEMFIFTNRIPVFLMGFYFVTTPALNKVWDKALIKFIAGILLTSLGVLIAFKFAFTSRLQVPIVDCFYVTVIPLSTGLILLADFIPEIKPITWLGSSTLEMYALQMIFGYKLSGKLFKLLQNKLLVNILTILIIATLSVLVHYAYAFVERTVKEKIKKTKTE